MVTLAMEIQEGYAENKYMETNPPYLLKLTIPDTTYISLYIHYTIQSPSSSE